MKKKKKERREGGKEEKNLFIGKNERERGALNGGEMRLGGGGIKSYVIGNAICGAHNVAFMRWCTHRRA